MLLEDVDPHHCFVELWIQGLDDLVVKMLLHKHTAEKHANCQASRQLNALPKDEPSLMLTLVQPSMTTVILSLLTDTIETIQSTFLHMSVKLLFCKYIERKYQ